MSLELAAWLTVAAALPVAVVAIVVRRQAAALGAAALVLLGAAVVAILGEADVPVGMVVGAGALVAATEVVRVLVDLRRRGSRRIVEPAVIRAAIASTGLAVAVAVAGAALVALAAGARTGWWLAAAVAALAGAVGASAAATDQLGRRRQAARRPAIALGVAVVVVVGAAGLVAAGSTADVRAAGRTSDATSTNTSIEVADAVTSRDAPPPPVEQRRGGGAASGNGSLVVVIMAFAALLLLIIFGRREQIVPPEDLVPDPLVRVPIPIGGAAPTAVETVDRSAALLAVDDALVALRADADPRTAIRLAYATLASGFGQDHLARKPSETEGDYLRRVLDRLGAGGPAAVRLTELFAAARFGDDEVAPVDDAMRADALDALSTIRAAVAR